MLSGASAITVPTASHSRRYSPKVCASRQRTSTTGSRNCSAWSKALTAPNETARRASPWAAIALAAAFIGGLAGKKCNPRAALRLSLLSCELVEEPRVARAQGLEVAGLKALAAHARTADHDEAPVWQPLGDVEKPVRPLVVVDRADPQDAVVLEARAARMRRGHVAARDDERLALVVAPAAFELEGVLRDDAIDAREAAAVEPAVACERDLLLADLEVAIGGAGVDRALAVPPAEFGHHTRPHVARALVVQVGACRAQRAPHGGEPRVHKAQHRDARALAVRLVDGDAVDHGRVRLPVIQGDHRDGVAVLGEKPREDRLLDFGAPDDLDVRIAREHRPDIRRDEA